MKKIYFILSALILISIAIGCSSGGSSIDTDDPEKAFAIAKRKFDRKDYVDAIDDFSLLKLKFPGSSISDKVQFYLAESYFYRKEYLLAAYEYETLIKNYPLSQFIPDARYRVALCYYEMSPKYSLDQEFTIYGISAFQSFLELYPQNKNVPDAEKKLRELKDKLAYRDFSTGELYMKLENYRAASLYFKSVYETDIESEWADDAMVNDAEVLILMKKFDEAKKVLEKFLKFFPKSVFKSRAEKLLNSIKSL